MVFHGPGGLGKNKLVCTLASDLGLRVKMFNGRVSMDDLRAWSREVDLTGYDHRINSPTAGQIVNTRTATRYLLFLDECQDIDRSTYEGMHYLLQPAKFEWMGSMVERQIIPNAPGEEGEYIWMPQTTVVLATNFFGELKKKCPATISRFGIIEQFKRYSSKELADMALHIFRSKRRSIRPDAVNMLGSRCLGIARTLTMFANDIMSLYDDNMISATIVEEYMLMNSIDENGLRQDHREYLDILNSCPNNKSGIASIASSMGTDPKTIETSVELDLLQLNYVRIVPGGRQLTGLGKRLYGQALNIIG